ncbi:hypothetical protein QNA08_06110 [Chelatococcus sp. SYSU_G07232]|uniref:Uncharacterized protein n=1 Tax=Chelatococcus albus TaxID=3047466 RepID=A0ABT7AEJ5_9HYPH|nr:hypothetical protein [Chelatococcus sp. SYSU_G07232]MDJ1157803.1 hypothetical protein [Chelatococcus sp. SYSU_G07232]
MAKARKQKVTPVEEPVVETPPVEAEIAPAPSGGDTPEAHEEAHRLSATGTAPARVPWRKRFYFQPVRHRSSLRPRTARERSRQGDASSMVGANENSEPSEA